MRSDGAKESCDFSSWIMFRGGNIILWQLLSRNIYNEKEKGFSYNFVIHHICQYVCVWYCSLFCTEVLYLWWMIGLSMIKDSFCSCVIWKSSGAHMAAACTRAAVISVQNHPMYGVLERTWWHSLQCAKAVPPVSRTTGKSLSAHKSDCRQTYELLPLHTLRLAWWRVFLLIAYFVSVFSAVCHSIHCTWIHPLCFIGRHG